MLKRYGLSFGILATIGLVAALVYAGTAKLTWTDPTPTGNAGAPTGHNVYRSTNAAACSASNTPLPGPVYKSIDTLSTSYDDTSVPDANGTVCYEITAKNAGGESARSNRVSKTTTVNPPLAPVLAIQ